MEGDHNSGVLGRSLLKEIALNFLIGGGALMVFANLGSLLSGVLDWEELASSFLMNGSLWVVLAFGNGFLVDWLSERMPWLEMPVKRLIVSLVVTIVYTLVAASVVIVIFIYFKYGLGPLEGFKALDKSFFIWVVVITMVVSSFLHGRGFFLSWKASILEAEKQKRIAIASQYESLKNQVNPHFLFNSLNVLSNLVYKDQDMAARFIKQMATVYRYVLETKEQEVVSLETELEALEAYLFLLKMRFSDKLNVEISLKEQEEKVVAPLTLQMLVENAVKHNIVSQASPLYIRIFENEEGFIVVENNLQKKENVQESSGIGLPNIRARYAILTDKEMRVEEIEDTFKVFIPIIKMKAIA